MPFAGKIHATRLVGPADLKPYQNILRYQERFLKLRVRCPEGLRGQHGMTSEWYTKPRMTTTGTQGGDTRGERVKEDVGRSWGSALVFKGRVCRADSYVQLTDSDRSTMSKERTRPSFGVVYRTLRRSGDRRSTGLLCPALPCPTLPSARSRLTSTGVGGARFWYLWGRGKRKEKKLDFDSILFFAPRQAIE